MADSLSKKWQMNKSWRPIQKKERKRQERTGQHPQKTSKASLLTCAHSLKNTLIQIISEQVTMKNRSAVNLPQSHPQRLQVKLEIVETVVRCLMKGCLQDHGKVRSDDYLQEAFVFLLKHHLAEELEVCAVALLAEFGVGSSGFQGWDEAGQLVGWEVVAQLEWLGLQDLRRVVPDLLKVRLT